MKKTDEKVPAELMKILRCPVDHAVVELRGDRIVCTECRRSYPVRDGIPVMLVEEAKLAGE
ncbi:MAG: Trm112 family protein [Chloroflexota bacterium]|nr:Trm112 family protein [Chloroflexota bacterium]